MHTREPENPFPVTAYYGPEYFCDRTRETEQLISNMKSGNSTTLISLRRIGKTGLIHHVIKKLPRGWKGIYIDILDTENMNQFLNHLATAVITSVPEKSKFGVRVWDFIKSLRPLISFDALTGMPQASFELKSAEVEKNINTLLLFLENLEMRVLIAIDEFQQITRYPENNTDSWLRSRIQQLKNVSFIFSGSQQQLMSELFTSPKRPFFRSTLLLKLEKIDPIIYRNFIIKMFERKGKELDPALAGEMIEWAYGHTFYVQQICNRVFSATDKKVTAEIWKHQAHSILKEQETIFFNYRSMLSNLQWQLLKAIAREEEVYSPTSANFITTYKLSSSASVLRSLNSLLKYDLVYIEYNPAGQKYYSVYDVWLKRWVKG